MFIYLMGKINPVWIHYRSCQSWTSHHYLLKQASTNLVITHHVGFGFAETDLLHPNSDRHDERST